MSGLIGRVGALVTAGAALRKAFQGASRESI